MTESIANEASQSVLELNDDIDRMLSQASAIVSLMALYPKQSDECPDVALPNAAWAVRDLLKKTGELTDDLHALAKAAQAAEVDHHA